MNKRPKIELSNTLLDKLLEISGYVILAGLWIFNTISFFSLPEIIPIHFDGNGDVDGYGKRATIFLLPIIGTFLFGMMTILNKSPENFNYSVEINTDNAEKQYTIATRLMRILKVIMIFIFLLIDYQTVQIAMGEATRLGNWFMLVISVLIFCPILYFGIQAYRQR